MPNIESIVLSVIVAADTGADLSDWERSFVETLRMMLDENRLWLSGAQRKSLFRMAEKLELWSFGGYDD